MAQPKGNYLQGDPGLKQAHGAGMAKGVARDSALVERGTMRGGLSDRQGEPEGDAISAQRFAVSISEDQLFRRETIGFAPLPQ